MIPEIVRGPKCHLLVGNLPEFARDLLGFFTFCAREYGDIVRLHLPGHPALLLNHPDFIEAVLLTHHRNFIKHSFFWKHVMPIFGQGLLTSEGDFWLRQRRMAQPSFHKERIAAYGAVMVALTERMLGSWKDGQVCDLHREMMKLTSQIVAKVLFDADVADDLQAVEAAFDTTMNEVAIRFRRPFRIPEIVPTPGNLRLRRAVKILDHLIFGIIRQRRAAGNGTDLLSTMIRMQDEDGSRMTDQQLRDEAITLFLAGHETTAITLTWTFYLLSQHPAVEERLIRELQSVLKERPPAVRDLAQLPFAEMVIMEAMRLYPPAYTIGREAVADCKINGYLIPAKTTVFISQWVMHRDPRYFPEPDAFRPDRWKNGLSKRLPRFTYFPFGGGPRICIGNSFAMMESVLLLATILQQFQVRLVPDHSVEPFPSITLRPKHGMRMQIIKRSTAH